MLPPILALLLWTSWWPSGWTPGWPPGVAPEAKADNSNSNRQILPLGESQAFMGNAGVGRATDTGAVYYNPSGLAELKSGRMSVSGSVYLGFETRSDALIRLDDTNIVYEASGFNTIPGFYVATYELGSWHGALSVLVPNSIQVENRVPFETPNTSSNLLQATRSSDLWLGLSVARKLGDRFSLGATLFGVQHQEANMLGVDVQSLAAPTTTLATAHNQMSLDVLGLTGVVGLSFVATDWIRFGLRAQSPLIELRGKADTFQASHQVSGATIQTSGEDLRGTEANYRLPFDFTFGTAITPAEWFVLLADVSLQLGAEYDSIPGSQLSEEVDLKPTPRFNFGAEVKPWRWLPIRLGFYYNPSAVAGETGTPGLIRENYFGFTSGIGLLSERVETGVGFFYLWSTGEGTPELAPGVSADVSSRGLGALLTASYLL